MSLPFIFFVELQSWQKILGHLCKNSAESFIPLPLYIVDFNHGYCLESFPALSTLFGGAGNHIPASWAYHDQTDKLIPSDNVSKYKSCVFLRMFLQGVQDLLVMILASSYT